MRKELKNHIDKEKEEREQQRLKEKLNHINHKIMVMSGKGGVGKSTVAITWLPGWHYAAVVWGFWMQIFMAPMSPKCLVSSERA